MGKKTVGDVIGEPETWPFYLRGERIAQPDMRGVKIASVIAAGNHIEVRTFGPLGPNFAMFVIEDEELRRRIVRAVLPGMDVHVAVALPISDPPQVPEIGP